MGPHWSIWDLSFVLLICLVDRHFALPVPIVWWCHLTNFQLSAVAHPPWLVLISGIVCQKKSPRHPRCWHFAKDWRLIFLSNLFHFLTSFIDFFVVFVFIVDLAVTCLLRPLSKLLIELSWTLFQMWRTSALQLAALQIVNMCTEWQPIINHDTKATNTFRRLTYHQPPCDLQDFDSITLFQHNSNNTRSYKSVKLFASLFFSQTYCSL